MIAQVCFRHDLQMILPLSLGSCIGRRGRVAQLGALGGHLVVGVHSRSGEVRGAISIRFPYVVLTNVTVE